MNLNDNPRAGTLCLTCPSLMQDGATADAETTRDFSFAIDGLTYFFTSGDGDVKLDADNDETVTTLTTAVFLISVDADLTISIVKCEEVLNTAIAAGGQVIQWPVGAEDTCPVGAIKIKNASASVFTCGTTVLSAANITDTYYNFLAVPAAPLVL